MAAAVLISVTATARIFGVHNDTVYRWIQEGKLAAFNRGDEAQPLYRIDTDEIAALLRKWGGTEQKIQKLLAPYLARR